MSEPQAIAELARLCEVYERVPEDLRPHQLREWLLTLRSMSYERGRSAVTHLIRTWTSTRFPPPGALGKAAGEVSVEGRAGAMAYYTEDEGSVRQSIRHPSASEVEWVNNLISMPDEEYE